MSISPQYSYVPTVYSTLPGINKMVPDLVGLSSCLLKSISWVQVSPSAHTYIRTRAYESGLFLA